MSRKVAFGGIFTALSVIFLYLAAVMPTGRVALYFVSGLPVALAIIEFGVTTGIGVYASASLLALLLVGDVTAVLPFILFFGHYGILKFYIEKQRKAVLEILLKLLAFNILMGIGYFLFTVLLAVPLPEALPNLGFYIAGAWIAAQFLFFLYDYIYSRLLGYYEDRIYLFRGRDR